MGGLPCIVGVASFTFLSFYINLFFFSFFSLFFSSAFRMCLLYHCFEIKSLRRKALAMRNVCGPLFCCVTRYHSVLGAPRNYINHHHIKALPCSNSSLCDVNLADRTYHKRCLRRFSRRSGRCQWRTGRADRILWRAVRGVWQPTISNSAAPELELSTSTYSFWYSNINRDGDLWSWSRRAC